MKNLDRRKLLRRSLAGLAALPAAKVFADTCQLTAPQSEGPFYPIEPQSDTDVDLTRIKGSLKKARGKEVIVEGIVKDTDCKPVEGALVEIWQACDTGKYNHPADPSSADLDPDFQYWGKAVTDKNGFYRFKTIKPGAYPATSSWDRPPHIHFKINAESFHELVTQMYFSDEVKLNANDRILQSLSPSERANVVVKFEKKPLGLVGNFPISIERA